MNKYDPKIHHRRSIRLKGHDYAGGGLYFVTICAHREFIRFAGGKPFGENDDPIRKIIAEEMQKTATLLPWMNWDESVVMPDHFHALIRIEGGYGDLGRVITGFKAGVTRTLRQLGNWGNRAPRMADKVPRMAPVRRGGILPARFAPGMRIWHRNYYEMIVRDDEEEKNIRNYIRMNPWKCVVNFGNGLRGIGNPALWNANKLGVLCSRGAPRPDRIPNAEVYLSGFHSPMEKKIFARLLEMKKKIIYCPAWGIGGKAAFGRGAPRMAKGAPRMAPVLLKALEENRMLILEMDNVDGDLAAAEQRNRFVIENSDELWLPYVAKGGMLERLLL